ncbi:hypothetical protein WR25_15678 [Diploscapter pachys]|uniref:Uncharacterized protein n=1 Tax=Diploscapter pachys TaxID=2018661 RepID=A0A2A2J3K3_9BILA|nr:hypothetical protein WR25_15678 [Diploscapter pachys]
MPIFRDDLNDLIFELIKMTGENGNESTTNQNQNLSSTSNLTTNKDKENRLPPSGTLKSTHNSNGTSKPRSSEDVPPASFPRRASEPVHRRKSVDTTASDGKRMSQAKIDKFQLNELHDASRDD